MICFLQSSPLASAACPINKRDFEKKTLKTVLQENYPNSKQIIFTNNDMEKYLKNLKPQKAARPNNIKPAIL